VFYVVRNTLGDLWVILDELFTSAVLCEKFSRNTGENEKDDASNESSSSASSDFDSGSINIVTSIERGSSHADAHKDDGEDDSGDGGHGRYFRENLNGWSDSC
jgi:hypothetical protein